MSFSQSSTNEKIIVQGKIEKIIFNQNNFMVGVMVKDNGEQITFKGSLFGIEKNEEFIFKGTWVEHRKFGLQLDVKEWERPIPKTKEKIIAYLSSPFIKGCGEKQALQIVNNLGENAIEIIMQKKENALIGIKGIGKKKAISIANSVLATYELQNIISELNNYGINPEYTIKFYKKYGAETLTILKKNPYELIKMKFISFPKADEIAKRIGINPLSGYRIEACINFILNQMCYTSGHCFITENQLIELALQMLNQNQTPENQINIQDIMQSIFNLEERTIIIEDGNVYPKDLYTFERKLAKKISYISSSPTLIISDSKLDLYIKEYQLKNQIILGKDQKEAIKTVLKNKITILTGGAGTGKTTVVKAIIEIYKSFFPKHKISLSAPTGRASRRLAETTGTFAQTNHKLLGFKQNSEDGKSDGFEFNEQNKLPFDFYIVDEMSMVDLHMAYALTSAMENTSKILFIGDVNQLPSINSGNVLKDLLETENIPKVRLTEIYRQAKNSQIIINSHRVNKGKPLLIDSTKNDMYFIERQNDLDMKNTLIRSVLRFRELGYDITDILVLSPIKKGIIGTIELNNCLQEVLNPKDNSKKEIQHGKRVFRVGDKIIQTINRAEKGIFNGDIGIITNIGKEKIINENGKMVEVDTIYSDFQGLQIKYRKEEWNDIDLAYSISIHKSQGGQSPIVIIPISKSHYNMLARNLIYTGITRAEKKLVLIGQQTAMNFAINNNRVVERNTRLKERIDMLFKKKQKKLLNI